MSNAMDQFEKLPTAIKRAFAWRAEMEHFGWPDHSFIGSGAKLSNVPLESGFVAPPNSTLITVLLRLGGRNAPNDAVVIAGYLDNAQWPADESLTAAMTLWNELSQVERNTVRQTYVTKPEAEKFARYLLERGIVPPTLKSLDLPKGAN